MSEYERTLVGTLVDRINEPRRFMQIVTGPRQTGKSTAIRQALKHIDIPYHMALASIDASSRDWLRAQWQQARNLIGPQSPSALLVIDEVQLVDQWASVVKALWDEDAWTEIDLRVVLSGSSSLLLKKGLAEGLTGRFELIRCPHWSFDECRDAFGYSLNDFLFFGGYPGSAPFADNQDRWLNYMEQSVIEPSISKDVIAYENIRKPALMRRLFQLACAYSGQELSYRKMLGQLDDAGNTTTLAHYLDLMNDAGLVRALPKYDGKLYRERASSPRLMVYDTGLMTACYGQYRDFLLTDPERTGHLVESAVGAHLLAESLRRHFTVSWWREGDKEVDFVISKGEIVRAIEVKSGRIKSRHGLDAFVNAFPQAKTVIIGSVQHPVEQFLSEPVELF